MRLTFPSETESAKFQFDPGTAAAEILMALNAGESEMCVRAKDSSRRFSRSSPAAWAAAAGGASAPLTPMRNDRADEDGSYRSSISVIGKAVRLIRFNRRRGMLSHCFKTHQAAGEQHAFLHSCHCPGWPQRLGDTGDFVEVNQDLRMGWIISPVPSSTTFILYVYVVAWATPAHAAAPLPGNCLLC